MVLGLAALVLAFQAHAARSDTIPRRTIAVDDRLAADANISVGATAVLAREPGGAADTVVVAAITRRAADPAEVARGEYRVRLHLDHLQTLLGQGDRVDRFAVAVHDHASVDEAIDRINGVAFGFRAHRSADIAVETSRTFMVVSRFHRAIGVIVIVAGAIFLLCIMLLNVEERRRQIAVLRLIGISRRTVIRWIMTEAAGIAFLGSAAGILLGVAAAALVNAHYQGVYRTPMAFALVTPNIVVFAVVLSISLGLAAGYLAARRLVGRPPLSLLGR